MDDRSHTSTTPSVSKDLWDRWQTLRHKHGLDAAIFYFFVARTFTMVATPIILLLITAKLTAVEQGYYFTFYSLVGLSLFFELGLGIVLTFFASHEYAKLSYQPSGILAGDARALGRLSGLLRQSLKWYGLICGLFVVLVLPVGFYFLSGRHGANQPDSTIPLILVIVFFALGTSIIPITSVLDGCGQVAKTQQLRLLQSVSVSLATGGTLFFGGRLYAVSAEFIASFSVFAIWLLIRYRRLMYQLLTLPALPSQDAISWKHEVFPMQLRVALNVVSVYFQAYIIVPLLFQFRGPTEAGQMGMSMRFANSIYSISVGWINVRAPKIGALVGGGRIPEANHETKGAVLRSVGTAVLGVFALLAVYVGAQYFYPALPKRMLPLLPTMLVALSAPISILLTGLSAYLRAYKIEPYGYPGLLVAAVSAIICTVCAYFGTASVLAGAYAAQIAFFTLPFYYWIFRQRLKELPALHTPPRKETGTNLVMLPSTTSLIRKD